MLAKYYGRAGTKELLRQTPLLLFAVSLCLFALAVVPGFRDQLRNSTFLAGATLNLELGGTVYEESVIGTRTVKTPVKGVQIEAGGFKTESDTNGSYVLKILSKGQQDLPVVLSYNGREVLNRVSFSPTSRITHKDFVLSNTVSR